MRLWNNWVATCVKTLQTKNQKREYHSSACWQPLQVGQPQQYSHTLTHKNKATHTEFLVPCQNGGFGLFLHIRQDPRASRCWWPIVQTQKYESSPSWTHTPQKHLWVFWIYFWMVGGPTPPGLGVAYPHIIPTLPWPRHEIPFVVDHLVS